MLRATALLAVALAASTPTQDPAPGRAPATEPPLRARVTLGGEAVEVVLGEPGRAPDGRELRIELLPARVFAVEGAFAFDYPREWGFLGSVGSPRPVDAWWSLSGEGAVLHLRRHGSGADEVLEQYVSGLEAMGGAPRRPVTRALGDRELGGFAVELEVGNVVGGGSRRWVQEVFAWREAPGVSWMLSVQRDVTPPGPWPDPASYSVTLREDADGNLTLVDGSAEASAGGAATELDVALASWRWE